jgi:hypothetical protein
MTMVQNLPYDCMLKIMSFLTKKEQIRYIYCFKVNQELKSKVIHDIKLQENIDVKNILNSLYFVSTKFPSFRFKQHVKDFIFERFINAYEGDNIIQTEDNLEDYHWECASLINQLIIPEYPMHESWGWLLNDIKYMHKFNTAKMNVVVAHLKTLLFKTKEKPHFECFTITFASGLKVSIDFQYQFNEIVSKIEKDNAMYMYSDEIDNDWIHIFNGRWLCKESKVHGCIESITYESTFSPSIRTAFFKLYYIPNLIKKYKVL